MTRNEPRITASRTAWIDRSMKTAVSLVTDSRTPWTSRLIRSTSRLQRGRDLDRVLARLLVDAQADAGLAVDADDAADVLAAVADDRDVAHVDRHAGARQHDQVADLVQAGELARAAQHVGEVALVDLAERHVLVLGRQQADDAVDRQARAPSSSRATARRRICRRRPPLTLTAATPGTRSSRCASVFSAMSRSWTGLKSPSTARNRIGNAVESNLKTIGGVGFLGQAGADAVDAAADVVGGDVEVGAPGEVEADDARAFARRGVDLLEAGDRADRLLERPRDRFLDLARADTRVVDADGDARQLQLRHQVDRQPQQRDRAEQDDDPAQHEHRDRAVDGDTRDAHGRLVVEGGPRRWPGVTARRNSGGQWWSDCCRCRR